MIQKLDKSSIQKICNDQVVVDLSTAVKELVENSLDAGATSIDVKLKEMGIESIEVSDNGAGIKPDQYEYLALKHHTSKLVTFDDLTSVSTFGFRGEALNALNELSSSLIISTKRFDQSMGSQLTFRRDGSLLGIEPVARGIGTTVIVEKLFHVLPVRRRDLERQYQKMIKVLQSYAVMATGVRMSVTNFKGSSKQVIISTQSSQRLEDNVSAVFGSKFLAALMPFRMRVPMVDTQGLRCGEDTLSTAATETTPATSQHHHKDSIDALIGQTIDTPPAVGPLAAEVVVHGLVSRAGLGVGRSDNERQFLFLNNRPIDSPKITKTINDVWRRYEMQHKPAFLLNLCVPAGSFDINLTPDKREVILVQQEKILSALCAELDRQYAPSRSCFRLSQGVSLASRSGLLSLESVPSLDRNGPSANTAAGDAGDGAAGGTFTDDSAVHPHYGGEGDEEEGVNPDGEIHGDAALFLSEPRAFQWASDGDRRRMSTPIPTSYEPTVGTRDGTHVGPPSGTAAHRANVSVLDAVPAAKIRGRGLLRPRADSDLEAHAFNAAAAPTSVSDTTHQPETTATAPSRKRKMLNDREGTAQETSLAAVDGEQREELVWRVYGDAGMTSATISVTASSLTSHFRHRRRYLHHKSERDAAFFGTRASLHRIIGQIDESGKGEEAQALAVGEGDGLESPQETDSSTQNRPEIQSQKHLDFRVLTKGDFDDMRVVGQFNLGFVIVSLRGDLFILDQHACDEKYRFESLQKSTVIHQQPLLAPMTVECSASEEMVIEEHLPAFAQNGFHLRVDEDAPVGRRVKLLKVPYSKEVQFGKEDLLELASMIAGGDHGTKIMLVNESLTCEESAESVAEEGRSDQRSLRYPRLPKILSMFASRACRSAVMIGTALNTQQMRKIVSQMSGLEQPWCCPHGRPTLRHMADVSVIDRKRFLAAGLTSSSQCA